MTEISSKPYLRFYDADMMPEIRYPATPVIESLRKTANFFFQLIVTYRLHPLAESYILPF